MKSFLPLAFTFSHVFYFFLIFNVSVMQLRAIAAWRFIESSTEKKKGLMKEVTKGGFGSHSQFFLLPFLALSLPPTLCRLSPLL